MVEEKFEAIAAARLAKSEERSKEAEEKLKKRLAVTEERHAKKSRVDNGSLVDM